MSDDCLPKQLLFAWLYQHHPPHGEIFAGMTSDIKSLHNDEAGCYMYWHNSDAGCGSSVSNKTQEGRFVMVVSTVLVASRIKARHTAVAVLSHDDVQQAM